ncbi:MAG: FKBP-type peptidyl-prolyl cis-trans isomerase [Pseudolysinimonas sp.]
MRLQPAFALLAVPALLLSLAACAPEAPAEPDTVGTDTPAACTPNGPVSDAVEVSGDFDTAPTVTFPAPISTPTVQRTVLIEGDGTEVQDGAQVNIHFTIYSGQTGAELDSTGYDDAGQFQATVDDATLLSGLVKTLRCATVGSRIVSVVPPADAFGDQGNEQIGVGPGEAVVFVVDVVGVVEPFEPNWTSGLPEVELGEDGTPVVTLTGEAPAELKLAVLEEGDGEVVTAADSPQLDYQGTSWQTGEVFDQSYGKQPINLPATQYVPGFSQAIVGQKVGSTLLVSIPPELAYGPTASDDNPLGGQSLLFVIQIRAIK